MAESGPVTVTRQDVLIPWITHLLVLINALLADRAVSGNSNEAKLPNADSNPGCVGESTGRVSDEVAGCEGTRGASSRFPGSDGLLSMTYAAARR